MSRYAYTGVFKDASGKIVKSGTITVYLAGTTTLASVYTASSGGVAVNSVISGIDGHFTFYVDRADYRSNQQFALVLSKTGFTTQTYDNIQVGLCSAGDRVSITDYLPAGYVTDGSIDYTSQTQAAITANPGKEIFFPSGTWLIATETYPVLNTCLWISNSKTRLRGVPGSTIIRCVVPGLPETALMGIWKNASIYTYETTTAYTFNQTTRGENLITMTTAGQASNFIVGDFIWLNGDQYGVSGFYAGELNVVTSVSAVTGIIGLAYPLAWNYNGTVHTAANVTADTLTDISIEGITFQHTSQAIQAAQVAGFSVKNCKFEALGATWNPFQLNQLHGVVIENNDIHNPTALAGIDTGRNCSRMVITKNRVHSQAHGIVVGEYQSHIIITENQVFVDDKTGTSIGISSGLNYDVIISKNQVHFHTTTASLCGILDGSGYPSENVIITGNFVLCMGGQGIKSISIGTIISNNIVYADSNGIYHSGLNSITSGNTVITTAAASIGITVSDVGHSGIITGNTVRGPAGKSTNGIYVPNDGDGVGPIITGNFISNFDYGIKVTSIAAEVGIKIDNNTFTNCTATLSGCVLKNGGTSAAIASGATIAHGLSGTPTLVVVQSVDGSPTAVNWTVNGTNIIVNYTGGGTEAFWWQAEYIP